MKLILSLTLLAAICTMPICAQTSVSETNQFNPHWYIQLQGGVGHTLGEADFNKLLSPAAALSVGRQFTPIWALRVGVSGWEAKGAWFNPSQVYKFNFMQVNADVMVDLANAIGGFKYDRTVNPYVFMGVGANVAFNNTQAKAINDEGHKLGLLWTGNKTFIAGRAGVGVNFRVHDRVSLGMEVNTNLLSDKFNSKKAGNVDWQMNALVGLTFRFGNKTKKAIATVVAPIPTKTVVEPEPVVEPAPVVEPTPIVTPPAPVVKKDAPAPPSPDTYKTRQNIFFTINSSKLNESENAKIDALVANLKANPKARVSIVGYADAPTGSSIGNYWLSGWRAISVQDALKKKGINASRIDMSFVGDKEQPYSDIEDNRVVIGIVK